MTREEVARYIARAGSTDEAVTWIIGAHEAEVERLRAALAAIEEIDGELGEPTHAGGIAREALGMQPWCDDD